MHYNQIPLCADTKNEFEVAQLHVPLVPWSVLCEFLKSDSVLTEREGELCEDTRLTEW